MTRRRNWRGSLGQINAAQQHLDNQGIDKGDLFLFYGWFRDAMHEQGRWRYVRNARDCHVIFGWLLVEERLKVFDHVDDILRRYPWLCDHPHITDLNHWTNTIYVAASSLRSLGLSHIPG